MTIKGDRAEFSFDLPPGSGVPPFLMQRVHAGEKVATDWEPNRAYTSTDLDTPNAEMKAIYDEDQKDRLPDQIDWKVVTPHDAKRREATKKLLVVGALHTGKDYEEAAFVFQHGDGASDYLLAHTLAMVSVSKGNTEAIWIASATLDRYLQEIGQKQIYGTQTQQTPKGDGRRNRMTVTWYQTRYESSWVCRTKIFRASN
jgi:hypothetical protein